MRENVNVYFPSNTAGSFTLFQYFGRLDLFFVSRQSRFADPRSILEPATAQKGGDISHVELLGLWIDFANFATCRT